MSVGGWTNRPMSGPILVPNSNPESGDVSMLGRGGVVASAGEAAIMGHESIKRNVPERTYQGLPRYMECVNRAEKGNVKVWCGAFNGVMYPEGATDLKNTWLQPGDVMTLTVEEAHFFFGDFLVPYAKLDVKHARDVINRYGGFLMEPKGAKSDPNDAPRIIGGPIGLPDILIQPMDTRRRKIGPPISIYELYDRKTRSLWVRPALKDQELLQAERELLLERLAEYEPGNDSIYDADGNEITSEDFCDCSPIQHKQGVVGCRFSLMNSKAVILRSSTDNEPNDEDTTETSQTSTDEKKPAGATNQTKRR